MSSAPLPPTPGQRRFSALARLVPGAGPTRPGRAVVALRGEIDVAAVPALTGLRQRLAAWGSPVTVIASRVTFIDSAGLDAVLALDPRGSAPALRAPSRAVQLLLAARAVSSGSAPQVPVPERGLSSTDA